MKKILLSAILASCLFLTTGCFGKKNMEEISINTTVYPITFIANTLYNENATINSIYPNGVNFNKSLNFLISSYKSFDVYLA